MEANLAVAATITGSAEAVVSGLSALGDSPSG